MEKDVIPVIQYDKEIPSEIVDILNLKIDERQKESLKFAIGKIFVSEIPIKILTELNKTPNKYLLLVDISKLTEANLASIHRHTKELEKLNLIEVKEKVIGKKKKKLAKALVDIEAVPPQKIKRFIVGLSPKKMHEQLMFYLLKKENGVNLITDEELDKLLPNLLTPWGIMNLTDAAFTDNYEITIKLSKKGKKEAEKLKGERIG